MKVVYETGSVILVCKAPGETCEEGGENSLPAKIRSHLVRPDAYVGVVHRLDTPTGGLMVYALTKEAAAFLSREIALGTMKKEYSLVCAGLPQPEEGIMEDYLFKDSRSGKVFPVRSLRKGAKEASLSYRVLQTCSYATFGEISLCSAALHTGRTHQIRVQFASRKHPLLGDGKYGSRVKGPLALWCRRLELTLPGEVSPRVFTCPPEGEFFSLFPRDGGRS